MSLPQATRQLLVLKDFLKLLLKLAVPMALISHRARQRHRRHHPLEPLGPLFSSPRSAGSIGAFHSWSSLVTGSRVSLLRCPTSTTASRSISILNSTSKAKATSRTRPRSPQDQAAHSAAALARKPPKTQLPTRSSQRLYRGDFCRGIWISSAFLPYSPCYIRRSATWDFPLPPRQRLSSRVLRRGCFYLFDLLPSLFELRESSQDLLPSKGTNLPFFSHGSSSLAGQFDSDLHHFKHR
jgi:hypothetical protein